jgi:hypothetical protein
MLRYGETVMMNLGLDDSPCGLPMNRKQRYYLYMNYLRIAMKEGWMAETRAHVGYSKEICVVVTGILKDGNDLLVHPLWNLVTDAGQDCIALYYPSSKLGYLYGPRPEPWGDFDLNFFQLPQVTL